MKDRDEYIHYGCGLCAPQGWRNFDASPTLWLQRLPFFGRVFRGEFFGRQFPAFPQNVEYGDIVRGLPIAPDSSAAVYCSHVLEHLALVGFRVALTNTYLYLKSGGVFRFVLPDLEKLASDYLVSDAMDASVTFMEQTHLGKKKRPSNLVEFVGDWLGHSEHLWMWDFNSVILELEKVGFRHIRRAESGDSDHTCFSSVENPQRWEGCLGVECVK